MNEENKKKHYFIYQTTNLVNNKIYIGKHITENIEDQYFGSGKYLQNAIKKYGLENFEFKILFELQNEEEMNLLEKCVVTQDFCDREDTYNINVGGDGGWSYVNQNNKNIGFRYANEHGLNNSGRKGKPQSEYQKKRCKEAIALDRKLHPENMIIVVYVIQCLENIIQQKLKSKCPNLIKVLVIQCHHECGLKIHKLENVKFG